MRKQIARPMPVFKSLLAENLLGFLKEKRAQGYKYTTEIRTLRDIDTFLCRVAPATHELSPDLVEQWMAVRHREHPSSHAHRNCIMRQFSQYLVRQGIPAYVCPERSIRHVPNTYVPRIFTFAEIRKLLVAVDGTEPSSNSPLRHLVIPEVFRVLYGCGLRVNEALQLRVRDVDLSNGVLNICDAKFRKSRLVPLAPSLVERLKRFSGKTGLRDDDTYFFPSRDGGPYRPESIYWIFRRLLPTIGIIHHGRGYGPRLHDLRHTFAVHRLITWYREKADLRAKLPVLSTYLGHSDVTGTQKYLHLVPELFPEVTRSLEDLVGNLIPYRRHHETN